MFENTRMRRLFFKQLVILSNQKYNATNGYSMSYYMVSIGYCQPGVGGNHYDGHSFYSRKTKRDTRRTES